MAVLVNKAADRRAGQHRTTAFGSAPPRPTDRSGNLPSPSGAVRVAHKAPRPPTGFPAA